MLKITDIIIKDKNCHNNAKSPAYECDIVVKYNSTEDTNDHNQINVKSLTFNEKTLNDIANMLLSEFISKMAE